MSYRRRKTDSHFLHNIVHNETSKMRHAMRVINHNSLNDADKKRPGTSQEYKAVIKCIYFSLDGQENSSLFQQINHKLF